MEKYELEKLRDIPIEDVATRLGIYVARHKALCPFHDDHHASLSFNSRRNTCRCFVCMDKPMGGIDLVMRYQRLDFVKACRWLASCHDIYLEDRPAPRREPASARDAPPFDASRYLRFFEHPWLNEAARRFLFDERRLDERVVRWCRLTSWTDRHGTPWLQTPYFDLDGRLVGVQNRRLAAVADDSIVGSSKNAVGAGVPTAPPPRASPLPRFRFPPGSHCGIYNLPVLRMAADGEDIYITEGCSDCWAMLSAGHKAVAIPSATLLGHADGRLLRDIGQAKHLSWHMYPDRDAPGERLFMQVREVLPGIEHHQLPEGCKDFAEYYRRR